METKKKDIYECCGNDFSFFYFHFIGQSNEERILKWSKDAAEMKNITKIRARLNDQDVNVSTDHWSAPKETQLCTNF